MKGLDEAAIRLGLALYRKTLLEGDKFYKVYDLVFDQAELTPRPLFSRIFSFGEGFWGIQEEAARILDGSKIAQAQRHKIEGSGAGDYSIKLTAFGKKLYELAYLQSDRVSDDIEGLTIEDLGLVLSDDDDAAAIEQELRQIDPQIDALGLTNFQRSTVQSYTSVLVAICSMPDRDTKLFWIVLDRLNQFAGVASLIVALIALRVAR